MEHDFEDWGHEDCLECEEARRRKIAEPYLAALRARVAELEEDQAGKLLVIQAAGKRITKLEAALELHWEHTIRCPAQRGTEDDDSSCNCGLWQILTPKQ